MRGLVLDRHGANWRAASNVNPSAPSRAKSRPLRDSLKEACCHVDVDADTLAARLKDAQSAKRKFAWIARKLDQGQAEKIRALKSEGVYTIKEPKRHYPNGALAAHVLGFVGRTKWALAGIERVLQRADYAARRASLTRMDAHGRAFGSVEAPARRGETVMLTIDRMVQYKTEQALVAAVEKSRAKSGTAIVLNPHTGEILALANAPTFDPNDPRFGHRAAAYQRGAAEYLRAGLDLQDRRLFGCASKRMAKPDDRIDCQMGASRSPVASSMTTMPSAV